MKVLISAYACDPTEGSEPGAGWEWARAAALNHEVWLLTRENNAQALEEALNQEPYLCLHPIYVDLPERLRFWKRGQRGVHLYYLIWQMLAWRRATTLHRRIGFDVAHHLTFAVDWLPAGIAWHSTVPFVWGPVGGTTSMPWNMWRWLGPRGLASEIVREIVTRPCRRIFGNSVASRAQIVLAQNHDVAKRFEHLAEVVVEPNVVINLPRSLDVGKVRDSISCRAAFVGRLIPLKGLRLAIEAVASCPPWTLEVYGEGPELEPARKLASHLGVEARVHFAGQRPRDEVLAALQKCDVLLHPSMHDSSPWVVGEAAEIGVPVIYLDLGGPPVLAPPPQGIPISTVGDVHHAIQDALQGIAGEDPSGRKTPKPIWTRARAENIVSKYYRQAAGIK